MHHLGLSQSKPSTVQSLRGSPTISWQSLALTKKKVPPGVGNPKRLDPTPYVASDGLVCFAPSSSLTTMSHTVSRN